MSNGGAVTVLYSGDASAAVTITGPGSFTKGGSAATFPVTLAAAKTEFLTDTDGTYTVSVSVLGKEVASLTFGLFAGNELIFDGTPSVDDLFSSFMPTTDTTTNLADIGADINTAGKYAGKVVWNSTTGKPVWADGPDADDTWSDATGTAAHTPA